VTATFGPGTGRSRVDSRDALVKPSVCVHGIPRTRCLAQDATAEDTKTLRDQAQEKALAALKSANIERSEYNRVAAFMNRDLDLRMQVMGGDS